MEKRSAEAFHVKKSTGDFVVRKRNHAAMQWLIICLSVIMVCLSVTLMIADRLTVTSTLFVIIGITCWYVATQMQHNRDLLNATEFQNALFASALGLGHKFCMIITRDGGVIYFDRPFQSCFPDFMKQPARSLGVFLELTQVSDAEREKLMSAIQQGGYDKITLTVRTAGGVTERMLVSIEPILRPSGYILLRGRDEKQAVAA